VLKGIVFRYRAGCPWRDLPERFGPWQTVWKRHARFSWDGTWDRILTELLADAEGDLDWRVSVDSTVCRVHQLGAGLTREVSVELPSHGAWSDDTNRFSEPVGHGSGRSRGALTTKLHPLAGRPRNDRF